MTTKDVYREQPLRFCGYANLIGDAFRAVIPRKIFKLSYAVPFTYVLADCADKSYRKYNVNSNPNPKQQKKGQQPKGGNVKGACIAAGDVFIWQMLASIIIPGVCINRVNWAARRMVARTNLCGPRKRWPPIIAGLATIPLIIGPIDEAIDQLMKETYRKLF